MKIKWKKNLSAYWASGVDAEYVADKRGLEICQDGDWVTFPAKGLTEAKALAQAIEDAAAIARGEKA